MMRRNCLVAGQASSRPLSSIPGGARSPVEGDSTWARQPCSRAASDRQGPAEAAGSRGACGWSRAQSPSGEGACPCGRGTASSLVRRTRSILGKSTWESGAQGTRWPKASPSLQPCGLFPREPAAWGRGWDWPVESAGFPFSFSGPGSKYRLSSSKPQ